jgi:hypothetical protein
VLNAVLLTSRGECWAADGADLDSSVTVRAANSPSNARKMTIVAKGRGGLLASLHARCSDREEQLGQR